jgi:hypothetical protein
MIWAIHMGWARDAGQYLGHVKRPYTQEMGYTQGNSGHEFGLICSTELQLCHIRI